MVKRFFLLTAFLSAVLILPVRAAASGLLSPGLSVLAGGTEMIASGLVAGEIRFSEADFVNAVGASFDSVTVTALPPASDGILKLGDAPVAVNQRIASASLGTLRFIPKDGCAESSFRFRAGGEYSIPCALRWTEKANAAPVTERSPITGAVSVWTQCDIGAYGTLPGSDPDGDKIVFEVTEYPEKGILTLSESGSYRYTPFAGAKGSDSFTYTVRDEWGHYAKPRTVPVTVEKCASGLILSDMEGHWAHNAALVMVSENAMSLRYDNGSLCFDPDLEMAREEFVTTVMKALGSGEIAPARTGFADDAEISEEASGYVARARSLGIVRGSGSEEGNLFRPKDPVTRAEAAVILNKIVGAEETDAVAVFADGSSVPVWAKPSLSALTSAGIFSGTGSGEIAADRTLTRAEVAELLLRVKRICR